MKRRELIALAGCAAAWHARSSRNCRSLDISAPGRLKPTPLPFSLGFARAVPVPNFVFSDGSHSQERYVAVGTRVCGVFQIKRSILPSQGQIIFVSDPWITPHGRKGWKSSKLRPLPDLSVVVLTCEAKRQHRSGNY
jgi:hypothetical protein